MLKTRMDDASIADVTGLTESDIQTLRSETRQ